jgi:hypothetical protein
MTYGLSAALANGIMNSLLSGAAWPAALAGCYAQTHIGDPGAAGTANPSSVTTRQPVTFSAAVDGVKAEASIPSYGNWTGTSPSKIDGVSLWTAASGGTFIGSLKLNSPVDVTTGQPLTLPTFTVAWVPVAL